jgi:hypothetical protein
MRAVFVVVTAPAFELFPRIRQVARPGGGGNLGTVRNHAVAYVVPKGVAMSPLQYQKQMRIQPFLRPTADAGHSDSSLA